MRLSTIAVAVSLALGATLMTACDRGADRSGATGDEHAAHALATSAVISEL